MNVFTVQVILRRANLQKFMEMSHEDRIMRFYDIASEKALLGLPISIAPLTLALSTSSVRLEE